MDEAGQTNENHEIEGSGLGINAHWVSFLLLRLGFFLFHGGSLQSRGDEGAQKEGAEYNQEIIVCKTFFEKGKDNRDYSDVRLRRLFFSSLFEIDIGSRTALLFVFPICYKNTQRIDQVFIRFWTRINNHLCIPPSFLSRSSFILLVSLQVKSISTKQCIVQFLTNLLNINKRWDREIQFSREIHLVSLLVLQISSKQRSIQYLFNKRNNVNLDEFLVNNSCQLQS